MDRALARQVYLALSRAYGRQYWWPADSPFEVMLGAVLVQNTTWVSVERTIATLRKRGLLSPEALMGVSTDTLAELLRPAGTFRVKTRRVHALCGWILEHGGLSALGTRSTGALRAALLDVHGIGFETADAILLYAFGRPSFVVDSYTRRILARIGTAGGGESYAELRRRFQTVLPNSIVLYAEYHALLVEHARRSCRVQPRCPTCVLRRFCRHGALHAPSL